MGIKLEAFREAFTLKRRLVVGVALIAAWFGALQLWPDVNLSPVAFVGFFLMWPYLIAPAKKKQ